MEEKLPLLKREEIKTMAKDTARLQEEEARKEKERIIKLQAEEKAKKTEALKPRLEPLIPDSQKEVLKKEKTIAQEKESLWQTTKPSLYQKVFIRIVLFLIFILFLFFVISFGYWLFFVRQPKLPEPSPSPSPTLVPTSTPTPSPGIEPTAEPSPSATPSPTVPPIPGPLIPVSSTKILEINPSSNLEEEITKTSQEISSQSQEGEFYRIVILQEGKIFGLKDFLEGLKVKTPENLFSLISDSPDDFTLVVFARKDQANRLSFLAKLKLEAKKEDLADLMWIWEKTMEVDWESFFRAAGKTGPAITNYFRNGKYQDLPFRYQTFSKEDLGICYLIFEDKLIFTSSLEGLKKTIDSLK